jgi:ABC-2 type transport system permease protein
LTPPAWLIAEREFRAYAATVSFWVALAIGPLAMAGALGLAALAASNAQPRSVAVATADPALASLAHTAITEAASLEGRELSWAAGAAPAATRLVVRKAADGSVQAWFEGPAVLSAEGQALAAHTVERDAALAQLGQVRPRMAQPPQAAPAAGGPAVAGAISRFALVMMLWLTLTGSLGMLLQAVVRERANRALESLLAAAAPWEIVLGKLAGVGAVSVLVLVSWLGSAAALSPLVPSAGGLAGGVLQGLSQPVLLARAGVIYVLAFGFYGLVTVAVGAMARDTAAAQNLSRPMFTVLLAAFFVALAAASGTGGLGWMTYVPPFTPFMLLLQAPGDTPLAGQLAAGALLAVAAFGAGAWAVSSLRLTTVTMPKYRGFARRVAT